MDRDSDSLGDRRGEHQAEAAMLEQRFGDLAPVYAQTRSEAANMRGRRLAAERWNGVARAIETGEASDD